jgi:hypothetical protein
MMQLHIGECAQVEIPQQPTHRFRKQVMKSLSTNENSRIVPTENVDRIPAVRVDRGRSEVVSQRTITPAAAVYIDISCFRKHA